MTQASLPSLFTNIRLMQLLNIMNSGPNELKIHLEQISQTDFSHTVDNTDYLTYKVSDLSVVSKDTHEILDYPDFNDNLTKELVDLINSKLTPNNVPVTQVFSLYTPKDSSLLKNLQKFRAIDMDMFFNIFCHLDGGTDAEAAHDMYCATYEKVQLLNSVNNVIAPIPLSSNNKI